MNKQPNLDYPYIGIPDTDEKEIEDYKCKEIAAVICSQN